LNEIAESCSFDLFGGDIVFVIRILAVGCSQDNLGEEIKRTYRKVDVFSPIRLIFRQ
jgi:hypothetical protein